MSRQLPYREAPLCGTRLPCACNRFQELRRIMVMQDVSNQTRIPETIVEYRHPVPVSSVLEAQRTSVSL
jgi:hypothetical protein